MAEVALAPVALHAIVQWIQKRVLRNSTDGSCVQVAKSSSLQKLPPRRSDDKHRPVPPGRSCEKLYEHIQCCSRTIADCEHRWTCLDATGKDLKSECLRLTQQLEDVSAEALDGACCRNRGAMDSFQHATDLIERVVSVMTVCEDGDIERSASSRFTTSEETRCPSSNCSTISDDEIEDDERANWWRISSFHCSNDVDDEENKPNNSFRSFGLGPRPRSFGGCLDGEAVFEKSLTQYERAVVKLEGRLHSVDKVSRLKSDCIKLSLDLQEISIELFNLACTDGCPDTMDSYQESADMIERVASLILLCDDACSNADHGCSTQVHAHYQLPIPGSGAKTLFFDICDGDEPFENARSTTNSFIENVYEFATTAFEEHSHLPAAESSTSPFVFDVYDENEASANIGFAIVSLDDSQSFFEAASEENIQQPALKSLANPFLFDIYDYDESSANADPAIALEASVHEHVEAAPRGRTQSPGRSSTETLFLIFPMGMKFLLSLVAAILRPVLCHGCSRGLGALGREHRQASQGGHSYN